MSIRKLLFLFCLILVVLRPLAHAGNGSDRSGGDPFDPQQQTQYGPGECRLLTFERIQGSARLRGNQVPFVIESRIDPLSGWEATATFFPPGIPLFRFHSGRVTFQITGADHLLEGAERSIPDENFDIRDSIWVLDHRDVGALHLLYPRFQIISFSRRDEALPKPKDGVSALRSPVKELPSWANALLAAPNVSNYGAAIGSRNANGALAHMMTDYSASMLATTPGVKIDKIEKHGVPMRASSEMTDVYDSISDCMKGVNRSNAARCKTQVLNLEELIEISSNLLDHPGLFECKENGRFNPLPVSPAFMLENIRTFSEARSALRKELSGF